MTEAEMIIHARIPTIGTRSTTRMTVAAVLMTVAERSCGSRSWIASQVSCRHPAVRRCVVRPVARSLVFRASDVTPE
jgi:hypothetical protein